MLDKASDRLSIDRGMTLTIYLSLRLPYPARKTGLLGIDDHELGSDHGIDNSSHEHKSVLRIFSCQFNARRGWCQGKFSENMREITGSDRNLLVDRYRKRV